MGARRRFRGSKFIGRSPYREAGRALSPETSAQRPDRDRDVPPSRRHQPNCAGPARQAVVSGDVCGAIGLWPDTAACRETLATISIDLMRVPVAGEKLRSGRRTSADWQTFNGRPASLSVSNGRRLTIGTLSFVASEDFLTPNRFLDAVRWACSARRFPMSLLLASGRTVSRAPSPTEILDASDGVPVLFESTRGGGYQFASGNGAGAQPRTLRDGQLVYTRVGPTADRKRLRRLISLLEKRAGVISIENSLISLVLLVCGENNSVHYGNRQSVMIDGGSAKLDVFKQPWLMLNPAHLPYPTQRGGYVKVGKDTFGHGPMLEKLVRRKAAYSDGTIPPLAVVHCNNFTTTAFTRSNAHVVFERGTAPGRARAALSKAHPAGEWIHARYVIRVDPTPGGSAG